MFTRSTFRAAAIVGLTALVTSMALPASAGGDGRAYGHGGGGGGGGAPTVVATGLDNPRLLAFDGSTLYIAEAGVGGDGPCLAGPEGEACFGLSGAVTRVDRRGQSQVLTGLPSIAAPGGGGAQGPVDVEPVSRTRYKVTIGLGLDPALRDGLPPEAATMGTQIAGRYGGRPGTVVADLAAYEAAHDPDGAGPDSNPGGTTTHRGRTYIADAGANTVISVKNGRLSTAAVIPGGTSQVPPLEGTPYQPVPTSVAVGPDGSLYVSQLTGFPFPAGGSSIWRVPRGGGDPQIYATGLTNVTDLAWYNGRLYAVQYSDVGLLSTPEGELPSGSLVRVARGSTAPVVIADDLDAPYGVALNAGSAYVTTCAVCAGGGEVLRVPLSTRR